MGEKGEGTKDRILSVAEQIILQKGFSGTSIDQIIDESGITKGGFFYHFRGKSDLARRLLERYLRQDEDFFRSLFARADNLTEDPLQQMLLFLKLYSEAMANLEDVHPGCLVASYTYQCEIFDTEVRSLAAEGVQSWRELFKERLEKAAQKYPMKIETELDELADMLTSIIEGSIIVSRVVSEKNVLVQQLLQYRAYLRLLFGEVS